MASIDPARPLTVSMGNIPAILEEYARSEELYDRRDVVDRNINMFVRAVISHHPSNPSIRGLQSLQEEFSGIKDAPEEFRRTNKIIAKMATHIRNIRASETGIDIVTSSYTGPSVIYQPLSVRGYTPEPEGQAAKMVKSTPQTEEELRKENQELRRQVQELESQRKIDVSRFDTVVSQFATKVSELTAELEALKAERVVSHSVVSPSVTATPTQQSAQVPSV